MACKLSIPVSVQSQMLLLLMMVMMMMLPNRALVG